MNEPVAGITAENFDSHFTPALKNQAVALCCDVWERILRSALEQKMRVCTAKRLASRSYRVALPPLSGYQNICDYIACVSYGISLGAIKADTATKLLYAAQVALSSLAPGAKTHKKMSFDSIPAADIPYR